MTAALAMAVAGALGGLGTPTTAAAEHTFQPPMFPRHARRRCSDNTKAQIAISESPASRSYLSMGGLPPVWLTFGVCSDYAACAAG